MTQALQITTKAAPKLLLKHLAAVHNSAAFTMVQRKICNVFLENASKNITQEEHEISVSDVMEAIGWKDESHVNEAFKDNLRGLTRTQIEWNILDRDKKNKWVTSTFLTHIAIKSGRIYYSYSKALIETFAKPNIYARLNLDIQKKLKNKYALILWEFIWGDLSSKKVDKVQTDWVDYGRLLHLMSLTETSYVKRFSLFKDRILMPALTEINDKGDITVRYDERKSGKRLTHLKFIGEKKCTKPIQLEEDNSSMIQKLQGIGLADRPAKKLLEFYSNEEIESAIAFFNQYKKKKELDNPVAFFYKALEKGWVNVGTDSEPCSKKETEFVIGDIDQLDEDIRCKNIRKILLAKIGESDYRSWFLKIKMTISEEILVVSCPSTFVKSNIETQFAAHLDIKSQSLVGMVVEC